ncbi:hypothetical protein [Hyphomicrobium sp. MC8b]|uniref:hypothetical protein n=1 Tax=Hyphomicrobium sp. MC8b TaxID=300273 RepID=UPI00391DB4E7
MPSRTDKLENEARERRWVQTRKLQLHASELENLAKMLWDEDSQNGWNVRYLQSPQLTALITIGGREFARFVRDENGLIGIFVDDEPHRFENKEAAFDEAVRRRLTRDELH